jgi:hypothetical protein
MKMRNLMRIVAPEAEHPADSRQRYIAAVHAAIDAAGVPKRVVVMLDTEAAGFYSENPIVRLDSVAMPRHLRRRGWGSKVMLCITELADQMGIAIALRAANEDAEEFFWRFGFEGSGRMLRNPQQSA